MAKRELTLQKQKQLVKARAAITKTEDLKMTKHLRLRLIAAFEHVRDCGQCGEDSWSSCEGGREAEALLEELKSIWHSVPCEGCDAVESAIKRDLPSGWTQTGRSRKVPGALAAWCPNCRHDKRDRGWVNPSKKDIARLPPVPAPSEGRMSGVEGREEQ